MKTHTSTLAVAVATAFLLGASGYSADEKKPANKSATEKLGDTLKKAGDTLTGTDEKKQETVNFNGTVTSVDGGARQFRASGSMPGVYSVTSSSKLTRDNATVPVDELKKGDAVSGTARRTGEDTFQVVSARATGKEPTREKSVLEKLIPGEKKEKK